MNILAYLTNFIRHRDGMRPSSPVVESSNYEFEHEIAIVYGPEYQKELICIVNVTKNSMYFEVSEAIQDAKITENFVDFFEAVTVYNLMGER